ncbi:50S ribosomal protein L17 [endosymbiont of Rhynchophorus ferrugineus]|uniref:50S ribosomal protein L17 n=2 Tax=Candidatus Nardonella TaxID=204619 RepID=A0A2Z5T991_9GAMM|nr:50S ribosomal protein L17 [endosymbiont of Rhynchophorus ferrugineus]
MSRGHYKMLFKNLCNSLIKYEKIKTTIKRAKEIKKIIEPIINRSKVNILHNKRIVYSYLNNRNNVYKLFNDIGYRYKNRNGGYTRINKLYYRKGDSSLIVCISLV